MRLRYFGCLLVLMLANVPWTARAIAQDRASSEAVDLRAAVPLDSLAAQLATKRVVFIGEIHDRYDHHLNQLEIIRRLHELDPALAIGVEYFQQPFQPQVDDYIAGRIPENEFLRATEYYKRWGYDYRLYAPIFRYAREQRIPVRALDVPTALTSAVSKVGVAGLSEDQREYLPREIKPPDEAYESRLRAVFETHPGSADFSRFVEVQTLRDEGMAESAAAYLIADAGRRLVILAGAGHVAFGSGIPTGLERRTNATHAIVLSSGQEIGPGMADYLLLSKEQELPPAGVLGIRMEEEDGECRIGSLSPGGAAEKAGLRKGDVLLVLDAQPVETIADVRLAIWEKKPGDRVRVKVRRKRLFVRTERDFEVELAAPRRPAVNP
jgi:uncharacterized iron-regulated protein